MLLLPPLSLGSTAPALAAAGVDALTTDLRTALGAEVFVPLATLVFGANATTLAALSVCHAASFLADHAAWAALLRCTGCAPAVNCSALSAAQWGGATETVVVMAHVYGSDAASNPGAAGRRRRAQAAAGDDEGGFAAAVAARLVALQVALDQGTAALAVPLFATLAAAAGAPPPFPYLSLAPPAFVSSIVLDPTAPGAPPPSRQRLSTPW
jgi:hypothetical protein